jgi:hypothetical protein
LTQKILPKKHSCNIEKLLFITCSEDTTRNEYEYRICEIASDERPRYKKVCAKLVLTATKEKSTSSSESRGSQRNGSRYWKRAPCGPGDGGKSGVPESLCPLGSSVADRGVKTTVKKFPHNGWNDKLLKAMTSFTES